MTKKNMLNEIINLAVSIDRSDITEDFAKKENALIEKRNNKDSKVARVKEAGREELAEAILSELQAATNPLRATDIAALVGISPQKATLLLKKMAADGKITVLKRQALHKLVYLYRSRL